MAELSKIAILGGTGSLGSGLALRWALAGYPVLIGSRSAEKAEETVAHIKAMAAERGRQVNVFAHANFEAAEAGDVVVSSVKFEHQRALLEEVALALQGKILIDTTVPLVPPAVARVQLPVGGSAGQIAQAILGEAVQVVSAFQNVAAQHLHDLGEVPCDVLVCGNSKEARAEVIELIEAAGMRGIHAGRIENAAAAEALTSLLIFVNKTYGCHAGIRLTDWDDHA